MGNYSQTKKLTSFSSIIIQKLILFKDSGLNISSKKRVEMQSKTTAVLQSPIYKGGVMVLLFPMLLLTLSIE